MSFKKPFRAVPIKPDPKYLARYRKQQTPRGLRTFLFAASIAVAVFVVGMIVTNWSSLTSVVASNDGQSITFRSCGMIRRNCVVDGDTFWFQGRKIRIADIDTPEISEPKCEREYDLGMQAKRRLQELLNAGSFELVPIPGRDKDRYGRDLRVVVRNGRSLGDQLVSEGLARTWSGRREPWC